MFRWYLKKSKQIVLCANPYCQKLVHAAFIFTQVFDRGHLEVFANLLASKIEPTFLCCTCTEKKEDGMLHLTRFR
jgi:hypothetical protein